jgi:monofunctional biosynthetic peptidoglycan transglycosylase
MRVRGDGNVYRLRTRTEKTGTEVAYTALFETEVDTWQDIYIPFAEMIPTYRGFVVNVAGPLDPASVRSFGLMVADKQQGQFFLEVDWINAVSVKRNESTYVSIGADYQQVPSLVYADS